MVTIESCAVGVVTGPLRGLVVADEPVIEIWVPYSVEAIKLMQEGMILAVRNTASVHLNDVSGHNEDQHYSLLRIATVTTRHFVIDAVRQDRSDEPVSVEGLLQAQQKEWRRTTRDPEENKLRLVVQASETGVELYLPLAASVLRGFQQRIQPVQGRTMLGETAYLMQGEIVERVVNRAMPKPSDDNGVVAVGYHTLYPNPPLPVLLDTDTLYRRHFGIFGFTGAGKSNLLSTLVAGSLRAGRTADFTGESNVVLFDVNNEYYGLLIDALVQLDGHVVFLDDELGDSMAAFLGGDYTMLERAAIEFLRTTTLSAAVERTRRDAASFTNLLNITKLLLAAGRFKLFRPDPVPATCARFLDEIRGFVDQKLKLKVGAGRDKKNSALLEVVELLEASVPDPFNDVTGEVFRSWLLLLEEAVDYCADDDPSGDSNPVTEALQRHVPKGGKESHYRDLVRPFEQMAKFVNALRSTFESPLADAGHSIGLQGMVANLHDNRRTLMLLLGSENSLRDVALLLGDSVYNLRRRLGVSSPTSVFIFDEADLFIPGNTASIADEDKDSVKRARQIATTLSRRGRKYGLGLGIATQRITFLDTSILAQLGTYLVGKLPRVSDRSRITEGFGVDASNLQSGISGVGDWMILSHVAVGDRGSPLPVHFPNADDRIVEFIKSFDIGKYVSLTSEARRHDYVAYLASEDAGVVSPVIDPAFLP